MIISSVFDLLGTLAFAVSGAFVGVHGRMDVFGVLVLSIATACGGGLIRDLVVGVHPPFMFANPFYVAIAALTAVLTFLVLYRRVRMSRGGLHLYARTFFWFDTLGLAAFTVDGVNVGIANGYDGNIFLLVFLGLLTGAGGGTVRDVLARRVPDVLIKDVYATASIFGGLVMALMVKYGCNSRLAMVSGFSAVVLMRLCATRFHWNLPRVEKRRGKIPSAR